MALQLRSYGIDLHRARYAQPARRHTLSKRVLRTLTAVELANAHDGCLRAVIEALPREAVSDDLLLAIVKAQRLHIEAVSRAVSAGGDEVHIVVDDRPLAERG